MTSSLIFDGTLELCDPDGHVSSEDYWFETLGEGSSFGDPQPVEAVMASLMRDGAITVKTGDDNREATFVIKVKAPDSAALDAGVAALHRATGKRTTLLFTPPDGYGPQRVWDVETSNLLEAPDDLAYVLRNEQTFRLRLICQPFRRGTELIIDDAGTPPLSGGTLLDDCESTTGWGEWAGGTANSPTVDSVVFTEGAGSLRTQAHYPLITTGSQYIYFYWLSYSTDQVTGLSLDTDTGGYLSIAILIEHADVIPGVSVTPGLNQLYTQVDGGAWQEVTSFVAARLDDKGFIHYVWPVDAGLNVTGLKMGVRQVKLDNSGTGADGFAHDPYTWYDDIELLPSATTDHQIVKQLTVEGSARTTGSLRISSPSEVVPLGHVLAITAPTNELPAGFQPDGERWVTQGTATADVTAIDGHYYEPDTDYSDDAAGPIDRPIFDVPVAMLTAGPYTIVALVKAEASTLTFGVQAQLNVDGTMVGPTSEAEVSPTGLTTGWQFVVVGTVYLPPLPVQSADATTYARLLFKGAKMANVYMIPAWQVGGRAVADFSIVDCGDGTVGPSGASSSLWIKSPSTMEPQGAWLRGPTTDGSNAVSAWADAKKPGIHTFKPGLLTAFLVSTEAAGPTLTLSYYDAYL